VYIKAQGGLATPKIVIRQIEDARLARVFAFLRSMKADNRQYRSANSSPEELYSLSHFTFAEGRVLGNRNGEVFQQLRQQNLEKAAASKTWRPHKIG
jgi:hypothetical protein